ncbi:MAG: hypothetical protein AAFP19_14605 [Bacteroidota bacterium]
MKGLKQAIASLLLLFLFSTGFIPSMEHAATSDGICIIDLGEDVNITLGDSLQLSTQSSCPLDDIVSINWMPATDLSCLDCLDPIVKPLNDQCYQVTIEFQDGTVASDEICIFVAACDPGSPITQVNSISTLEISDMAVLNLSIARTQYVSVDIIEDDEVTYAIWEGWLKPGDQAVDLNFSAVPAGNYELKVDLYPNDETLSITKL